MLTCQSIYPIAANRFDDAKQTCLAPPHHDTCDLQCKAVPWRHWLRAQCAFHEGDYEGAVSLLHHLIACQSEQERVGLGGLAFGGRDVSSTNAAQTAVLESIASLPAKEELILLQEFLRDAQRLRHAGNELMKVGDYSGALKHYADACAGDACF